MILIILMITYSITIGINAVEAQSSYERYSENLHIYQIYDKTIVVGIFDGKYVKQLLPNTLTQGLKYFSISVAKYTPDTANVYWFLNDNPERDNSYYLFWRGIQINVTYQTSNYNPNDLINWISDKFQTAFQQLKSTSISHVLYSSGNLDTISELLINNTVDWNAQGFLNLFRNRTLNYIEYRFSNEENKLIIVTVIKIPQTSIPRSPGSIVILNYTRILNTVLISSPFSDNSSIMFHLYGLSVNRSDISYAQNIKWVSGPNNHWVTTGFYKVAPNTIIQKMNVYVTLFNQPLIFYLIPNKSYLSNNDVLQVTVNVTNPNTIMINNVTVNLIIPDGFKEAPSTTIYIKNIKPNSTLSQEISLHYTYSEQSILRIRSMYSYYDGITAVQGYTNDIIISTKHTNFPSIIYYIKPLTATSQIDGSNTVEYEVDIHNVGNDNATEVTIHMNTYHINLGQISKGGSFTYKIKYDPKNATFAPIIPLHSEATPPIYITFTYNNSSYTSLSNTTLPSLAKTFSNYQILVGTYIPQSILFTSSYTVKWNIVNIGGSRATPIILNKTKLTELGLVHYGQDDFYEEPEYLIASKNVAFNHSIIMSLSLTTTRTDTFILPPLFQNTSALPPIMIEPAIFTNAVYISKNVSKLSLNIGDTLDIAIKVQNLGNKPIFSVKINDTVPQGWELTEGISKINITKIDPHNTYILKYTIKAINPQSQILPPLKVQFSINNFNLMYTSNQTIVYIKLLINLNVVAWNNEPLENGFLIIKDTLSGNATKISISNGKAAWSGYVGIFNIQAIYRNITVYNSSVSITGNNSTFTIKASVFPFIIRTVDVLNNPTASEIYVYMNQTLFYKGNDIINVLLPSGSYSVLIKSNGKTLSIPLEVTGPAVKTVNIRFNIIQINGVSIDVPALMLMITLLFIIILAYLILKKII